MLKRAIFMVFTCMLVVTGFGIAQALEEIDGLVPYDGGITSQGTYVNPGGIGDSLIYGYYNVRGNLNLFNIVNTSAVDGVKVRIVFRNAKNSRECLDYSICLSKGDVYTAFLVDSGTTAAVCPLDVKTLTAPTLPATCQPFKYEGAGGVAGVTADDCREGYFEVIGMTTIPAYDSNAALTVRQAIPMATESDCRDWAPSATSYDAGNMLMGNNTIFEMSALATYSANAVALANTAIDPVVITAGVEKTIVEAMSTSNPGACDLADFIFTKSDIISPYDLIAGIGGETEIVITFPTRLACHSTQQDNMFPCLDTLPASACKSWCTPIEIAIWDDNEHRLDVSDFSPSVGRCLPHEVNVVKLGGSQIWNSTVANTLTVGSFDLGWVDFDLVAGESDHESCSGLYCSNGLPAIALTTQSFVGGAASYMLPAAYKTSVELE